MDLSKEYILMCEKAVEIQKEWSPEEGDLFHQKNYPRVKDNICFVGAYQNPDYKLGISETWLPHQDQLQDMLSGIENSGFYTQIDQLKHMLDMSIQEIGHGLTYEKLWLKVVMRKYNKVWTGTTWELRTGC